MMSKNSKRWFGAVSALGIGTASLMAGVIGQWDFDNGDLSATQGPPLTYLTWGTPNTADATVFGSTTTLGLPDIDGQPAKVMGFPAGEADGVGYVMPVNAAPNGGGTMVNQWTIIYDILFPADSSGKWRSFIETDQMLVNPDGDLFVNPGNGIGISGQYDGEILPDTWYRVTFVIDQGDANQIRKYINGTLVGVQAADGMDGRWALTTEAWLFHDNDGDTAPGYVNSIQLRDTALTDAQVVALGGPSANGIPLTIPKVPSFIVSTVPADGDQSASPKPTIEVVLDAGETAVDEGSIQLQLDGNPVATTVTKNDNQFTIQYPVPELFAPETEHTVVLNYADDLNGAQSHAWSFKVALYKEIKLPDPVVLETFDEVAEGELPAGWVATNRTDSITGAPDLTDPNSDTYMDWTVISHDTLANVFGQRRLNFHPVVLNGEPLNSLVVGNFAYAESDHRSGNQVQVLTSPDFDLSDYGDVYLAFYSTYEQNQDGMGAVEYSTDQGVTWYPALYMIDGPDVILDADGNVDAVATMTTPRDDQAYGLEYGAFIGAEITPDLAPFISARVNDDSFESKRVEVLRLEHADHQAKVRLRFVQAGTASWYFGVDNVGLYSISLRAPEITTQPVSGIYSAGSTLTLSVEAIGTEPLHYQWQRNGENLPGQTEAVLTIPNVQADDVGEYTVVVSNEAGSATSARALVRVFAGPIDQDLVVHLPLDGDYQDASGHDNHGSAMGTPAFVDGQVGAQAIELLHPEDYVTLGDPADLNFGIQTDFSISFWTKVVEWTSDPSFISNKDWNSGGNQGYVLAIGGDGHFQWNLSGPPGGRKDYDGPAGTFSDAAWHHVVVTFERKGNATTYIDGQQVDSRPLTDGENDVSTPNGLATNIGQDGTGAYGSFTDVLMDDVGIWRRVLTPQEVAGIYEAGLQGKDLSTVVVTPPAQPEFTGITLEGDTLTITWDGGGTLQSAPAVTGPWTDVDGAASPYQTTATGAAAFYRLKQ